MTKFVERPSFIIAWLVGWTLAIGLAGWWMVMRVANHARGVPEYVLDGLGVLAVAWFAVSALRRIVRRNRPEQEEKAS